MATMSEAPSDAPNAIRAVDVECMANAVLHLRILAGQSRRVEGHPPLKFALRYGLIPPVLAGRSKEMKILQGMVCGIQRGEGDECQLGLHGIRGQGKTALIKILSGMAVRAGIQVVTLRASESSADFTQAIMDAESIASTTSSAAEQEGGIGVNAIFMADGRTRKARQTSETRISRMTVDAALKHRLEKGDRLLIILDEAHTLREEAAQALFNAYQDFAVRGAALGLAFAGTPDLWDRLSEMRITFTERPGPHGQTPLQGISDANAALAVLAPFAERGVLPQNMAPGSPGGIVEAIAEACRGYPYYTQLLGDALRQVWVKAGQPDAISLDHMEQALERFEAERRKHHHKRFLELQKIGALECARNVAAQMREREFVTRAALEQCMAQGLQERGQLERAGEAIREKAWIDGVWSADDDMATALLHLGFLWSPEGGAGDRFEAGIPSLAGHVLKSAPPPAGNRQPSSPIRASV